MNIWKGISQALVILLMVIAAVVSTILIAGQTAWDWIIAYWITLTLKNAADLFAAQFDRNREKSE